MIKTRHFLLGLAVLAAFCVMSRTTRACDDSFPNSLLDARAFGCSGSLYGLGYLPVPPYFALHPPVYYGERYYRSYGESPFARADYSSRPKRIQAQVVINPFVTQPVAEPAAPTQKVDAPVAPSDQVTVHPQMIENPYYTAESKVASRQ